LSYRDRRPTETDLSAYDRAKLYRHVFSTPEGAKVLDDIVQRICLVDAIVTYQTNDQAARALERKNVGLEIASLVLRPITDEPTKPKVNS
jgi:predicted amidophosphoribosyltransferase